MPNKHCPRCLGGILLYDHDELCCVNCGYSPEQGEHIRIQSSAKTWGWLLTKEPVHSHSPASGGATSESMNPDK